MALPRYHFCNWIKSYYLRLVWGSTIGKRCIFYSGVKLYIGRRLTLGDDVDLAAGVIIGTMGGVSIGDRTLVGYETMIMSMNHKIPEGRGQIFFAGHVKNEQSVHIGSDCWIGGRCIILPGVTIGDGSVIGAGSIVTKDVPEYSIAVGVPARVIRKR